MDTFTPYGSMPHGPHAALIHMGLLKRQLEMRAGTPKPDGILKVVDKLICCPTDAHGGVTRFLVLYSLV